MKKRIHIVSFDVPFPADYGGVIDVFNRVKWFSENGWEVILHCFEYKRPRAEALENYAEVHYYPRPTGMKHWFSKIPFIVKTRIHPALEKILMETNDEVILEGLHCAHYLNLQPGKFYVRTHNVEHAYYAQLAKGASFFKKIYYQSEARKLKKYESVLSKAKGLLVISSDELAHFKKINAHVFLVPSHVEVSSTYRQTEPFVLFHGNLSVEENEEAAHWILEQIVPKLTDIQFVIAGKNPSAKLMKKATELGVEVVPNPSQDEMNNLLQSARIHLLWTGNRSGLKLKFLVALGTSGHVLCNDNMASGLQLNAGFQLFSSSEDARIQIEKLIQKEYPISEWQQRQMELSSLSLNQKLKDIFG